LLETEKTAVIKAIHLLDEKVTVADVVTKTGFSQNVVQSLLDQIAANTEGN